MGNIKNGIYRQSPGYNASGLQRSEVTMLFKYISSEIISWFTAHVLVLQRLQRRERLPMYLWMTSLRGTCIQKVTNVIFMLNIKETSRAFTL